MHIPHKLRMLKRRLFRRSEGEQILKVAYKRLYGKDLDFDNPKTFSEKLFHRMISINRNGNALFTRLADKYAVRDYVKGKVGEQYLVKLIWHGQDPRDIPFAKLPEKCVIKTNHGSGGHFIINGAFDKSKIIEHFSDALKDNYYWDAREFHYYQIIPRILVEEFVEDGQPLGPLDYRFWCFNGVPEVIQVDNHAHSINPFYDSEWNKLDLCYRTDFTDTDIAKPDNLNEMLSVASKLAEGIDFVRVDLYNVNGRIFVGELTFTPVAGGFKFKPESWDVILGQKWR
jgi:hypothetical protein